MIDVTLAGWLQALDVQLRLQYPDPCLLVRGKIQFRVGHERESIKILRLDVRADSLSHILSLPDIDHFLPAVAANPAANSPASVTNGATSLPSSGATVDAIESDLTKMLQSLQSAGVGLSGSYWIMSERSRISLLTLRTTSGDQLAFPSVGASNSLFGYPIVASDSVPLTDPGDGSTPTTLIALIQPSSILLASDDNVVVDASREASVALDDTGNGTLVSLWQQNLVGLRAEMFITWQPARAGGVVTLTGVTY